MTFRSRSDYSGFSPEKRTYPKTEPRYGMEFDKDTGRATVVLVGATNVYAQKQEALPDTLIYNLIDKVQRTGDMSLLGEAVTGFCDTLSLPRSLMDAENIRLKAEQIFKSLPQEERAKYGSDLSAFLKDVDKRLKDNAIARAAALKNLPADPKPTDPKPTDPKPTEGGQPNG